MPAPTVLIVANPYEAERMRRAVEEGGLRAVVSDGGEDALELCDRESPSVVVLATGLHAVATDELLAALRSHGDLRVPVILIENPGGPLAVPSVAREHGADLLLLRPIDPILLLVRIEQLGEPDIEIGAESIVEVAPAPPPAASPKQTSPGYPLRSPTEVMAPPPGLLRADEAMDFTRTIPDARSPPRDGSPRRALGRRLEDELSAAEQRLFPGTPARASGGAYQASSDVDLDTLGLDTLPGIELELGLDPETRANPSPPAPPPPPIPPPPPRAAVPATAPDELLTPVPSDDGAAPRAGGEPLTDAGDLGEVGVPDLVARLYRAGFTGRLVMRRGEGERSIYFEAGYPVWAASNLSHDHLADLLWREGRLSREDHARVVAIPADAARRVGDQLVQHGVLPREELGPALRRHIQEVLYSCFAWEAGTFRLSAHDAAPADRVRIDAHPYAIATEGIRRKYGLERLTERVGPPSTLLAPTTALERIAALAGLGDAERVAVKRLIEGPITVAELGQRATLPDAAVYALAHALLAIGGAARSEAVLEKVAPRPDAVDRERAMAKYSQISDGDYFDVLGVARDATPYEIRRAWERLRLEFASDGVEPAVREELADRLGEIAFVIDEAYRVLADEEIRQSYASHLAERR